MVSTGPTICRDLTPPAEVLLLLFVTRILADTFVCFSTAVKDQLFQQQ